MKNKLSRIQFLILGTLGIFFFFTSCNNQGAGCFDKAGDTKTVTVDVPTFTTIDVASNIDVQILTSGHDRIEVTTGENLISGISLKVEEDVLFIDNLNSCFWSKGYVKPLVTIRNADLASVVQHGYGRIYTTDTLVIAYLTIQVEDASGAVDLVLDAVSIRIVSNNIGPITLKGKSSNLKAGQFWSDGILNAKDLSVHNCTISHNGSNRMDLNVKNSLKGSINSIGNVYLFGQNPALIEVDLTDEGKVIKKY